MQVEMPNDATDVVLKCGFARDPTSMGPHGMPLWERLRSRPSGALHPPDEIGNDVGQLRSQPRRQVMSHSLSEDEFRAGNGLSRGSSAADIAQAIRQTVKSRELGLSDFVGPLFDRRRPPSPPPDAPCRPDRKHGHKRGPLAPLSRPRRGDNAASGELRHA